MPTMIKDVLADQLYNSVFSVKAMYNDLMVAEYVHVVSPIWKLKLPLKIKVFLWYPKRGIILTKDNLLKRNWKGDGCCCFCSSAETIQHLFFDCHVAKSVWYALFFTFGIQPPVNFAHLLGSWLAGFTPNLRKPMLVRGVACCWAIWLTRNDAVFSKTLPNLYLQVLFRRRSRLDFGRCYLKRKRKIV